MRDVEREHALVTITGPSGIGNTRLARQMGRSVLGSFSAEGGVWFCTLSACSQTAEVEGAVARMLEVPQAFGNDLSSAIANRGKTLLILDNLDSAATEVGPLLESWIDRCPQLQVVTTSIVPIEVEGAVRYDLGPLEAADAVALYLERAHRAWAGNTLECSEQPAIEELVGRLDRIPLAIELAAARVRVLPPRALLSRFGDRFELLCSGKPGRHGSLLRALTLTWEFLSEKEQLVLARASVFEGGFLLEAAREVLMPAADEVEVLDLLDGLRNKALLQLEDSGSPRFHLYESVRDYAARELRRLGLEADARRRHVEYFSEQGEAKIVGVERSNATESLRWLEAERENLVAALLGSADSDPASAARAGIVLSEQIRREGYLPSGIQLLERTLDAARKSGDRRLLLRSISRFCSGAVARGNVDVAAAALDEGLELARELGDQEEEGELLILSGWVNWRGGGSLERSVALFDSAIAIGERERLPLLQASALLSRGQAAHAQLAVEDAARFCSRALTILREHDYPFREIGGLISVGVSWARLGRFDEARTALQTVLVNSRERGNRGAEGTALMNLGGAELLAGRLGEAERHLQEALPLQRGLGNRRGVGLVIANLGCISLERGELEDAERHFRESIGIFLDCGDQRFRAGVLPFRAVLEARLGRLRTARENLEEARAYFLEADDRVSQSLTDIAEVSLELAEAASLGSSKRAEELVRRARKRLRDVQAAPEEQAGGMFVRARLLRSDLEDHAACPRSEASDAAGEVLLVGKKGAWFQLSGKPRVDLRRRTAIRRMLSALVANRLESPGEKIGVHDLFDVGWPGEEVHPELAQRRVYLGMFTLRDMGLAEVLINQSGGYLLDPDLPLRQIPD